MCYLDAAFITTYKYVRFKHFVQAASQRLIFVAWQSVYNGSDHRYHLKIYICTLFLHNIPKKFDFI